MCSTPDIAETLVAVGRLSSQEAGSHDFVRKRRWPSLIGLGVALLAVVALGVWPQTADGYRSTVEQSVQDTISSVGTAHLAGTTALKGNTFGSYEDTVLDDVRSSVAIAVTEVIELQVPDSETRRLRDEVLPLLQESARLIGDLEADLQEENVTAAKTATAGLASVGEQLAVVLDGLR